MKCDSGFRGMEKKYHTKCFYHSDLDKEIVRGLIAKGNKAGALTLPKKQTIVKSRAFVGQGTAIVGQKPCRGVKMLNNDFSHFVGQSASEKVNNEWVNDSNKTSSDTNEVTGVNVVRPLTNTKKASGVTSINTNHLHECTGCGDVKINSLQHETIPIYNVTADADDKFIASLLSRSVSKKIFINDHEHCDTFKKRKLQTEFEFGFIPLTNLVVSHSGHSVFPGLNLPLTSIIQLSHMRFQIFRGPVHLSNLSLMWQLGKKCCQLLG